MRMVRPKDDHRKFSARKVESGRLLFPLERAAFQFIDQAYGKDEGEKKHGPKDGNPTSHKFPMGKNPGNEKHDVDVKKDEEHGRDVEFDRIAGFALGIGCQATFIGRILDFSRGGFLSEKVACRQDTHAHPDGQEDLD